jgi:hypothetical protein
MRDQGLGIRCLKSRRPPTKVVFLLLRNDGLMFCDYNGRCFSGLNRMYIPIHIFHFMILVIYCHFIIDSENPKEPSKLDDFKRKD